VLVNDAAIKHFNVEHCYVGGLECSYLHSCDPPVIHGNLTTDTIFIQHNGLIKIGSGNFNTQLIGLEPLFTIFLMCHNHCCFFGNVFCLPQRARQNLIFLKKVNKGCNLISYHSFYSWVEYPNTCCKCFVTLIRKLYFPLLNCNLWIFECFLSLIWISNCLEPTVNTLVCLGTTGTRYLIQR